jgi:hypothetical protein
VRAAARNIEVAEIRSRAINAGFERLGEAESGREHDARKYDGFTENFHGSAPFRFVSIVIKPFDGFNAFEPVTLVTLHVSKFKNYDEATFD